MNKFYSYRVVLLLWFLLMMVSLVAQVQSNSCTSTFFSALVQLIPCRAAVSPFSPIPPSDACCNALKALGQPCLCVLVNGPPISGVDRSMASMLPEKCIANFEPYAVVLCCCDAIASMASPTKPHSFVFSSTSLSFLY
ncbi:hypothetical protein VNO77_26719 [Canavalia gladiata]|uniref:Bifunctional inhibitor/plant lipid transfer protein/seed storage helical domain-containing protein n=1 Tax=Canavalia gladiata TaxID=3824 RepID=A0AAN9Q6I8_CANGL